MTNAHLFKAPSGTFYSSALVESATPLPDGRWSLTMRSGGRLEVENSDFIPARLVRARRDEEAIAPDGTRRRVLYWAIRAGDPQAQPVLGLQIADAPPPDFSTFVQGRSKNSEEP
jgi:hypothetical protein